MLHSNAGNAEMHVCLRFGPGLFSVRMDATVSS